MATISLLDSMLDTVKRVEEKYDILKEQLATAGTDLRVRVLVKRDNKRWESYLIPITVKDVRSRKEE